MPAYRYTAYDAAGKMLSGVVEASGEPGALSQLAERKLVVVDIAPTEKARQGLTLRPLPLDVHYLFCKSLAGYLKSGLPVTDALRLLAKQSPDPRLALTYEKLLEDVQGGRRLSAAMEQLGIFRESLVGMVASGEQSGSLPVILRRGADLFRQEHELRRKVKSALTYPLVMLVFGLGVVVFLLTYVVPKFAGLFAELGQVLPLPTRILLAVADGVSWAGIPLVALGALAFFWLRRRKKPLNLPGSAALRERIALSLVFSQVATLVEAGIPLVQALEMAAPLDRSPERWKAVADLVRQGHRFAAALEKEGPVTEDVVYMIRVGEMGNDLPEALRNAAENAWEVAQARMERLANLAGPALILLLGSGVGFVVVAVLLPIFDISALVK